MSYFSITQSASLNLPDSREVVAPGFKSSLPYVFLLLASTGIMLMTGNPFIVFLWLTIWFYAAHEAKTWGIDGFLVFFLGIGFLYPVVSNVFSNIQMKSAVVGCFLILFFFLRRQEIVSACKEHRAVKIVVLSWIGWGVLAYLPVLVASVMKFGLRYHLSPSWDSLATEDTLLKTTTYIIPNVLACLIPILAIRKSGDLPRLVNIIRLLTVLILAGAFAKYLWGVNFENEDYSTTYYGGSRMNTFSMPDANGFGRLLLMPMILFTALAFKNLRLRWTLVIAAGMVCVFLTYSRTTYISLGIGMLVIILANLLNPRGLLVSVLMVITVAGIVESLDLQEQFMSDRRLSQLTNWNQRMYLQEVSMRIVTGNPFFGAHPGGYAREMFAHGFSRTQRLVSSHNMFLGVAVEWGIPMALVMLAALVLAIRNGLRALMAATRAEDGNDSLRGLAVFSIVLPVVYLVHGLGEIVPPEFVFFAFGVSCATVACMKRGLLNAVPHHRVNGNQLAVFPPLGNN
jgi:hypothetical protein